MKINEIYEKRNVNESKIDRSGAQNPEVLPKGHKSWTAAEKRAWNNNEPMPYGTTIKNVINRIKTVLKDKSNYTIGDSGDPWSISAAEIRNADDDSIITLYGDDPVITFWFKADGSWFNSEGKELTASEVLKEMRGYPESSEYGWAETILKQKAIKIVQGLK